MKISVPVLITLVAASLLNTACQADDDEHERKGGFFEKQKDVAAITDPVYKEECGSCHFAYQPGLLPARSWKKVMSGLADHFGDNAELGADTQKKLTDYLLENSADKSSYRRSQRLIRNLPADQAPVRITELPYFKHEHKEIRPNLITENKEVRSLSHCQACHRTADTGSYSEREINIPGFGPWKD